MVVETMTDEYTHPLIALKEKGEEIQKRREQEKVHCPECDTTVWKDDIEDAIQVQEEHDAKMHDGERVTKVNGILPPEFTEEEKQEMQENVQELLERIDYDD